ncbi:hypothetical protein JCM11641_000939 [Rhodosporidiobolus odoratus]
MRFRALSVLVLASSALAVPYSPSSTSPARQQELPSAEPLPLERRHGDHEEVVEEQEETGDMAHPEGMQMSEKNDSTTVEGEAHAMSVGCHSNGDENNHHHGPVLLELDETQILLNHAPDPPSYFDFDSSEEGKPALLYVHIVLMCLAFFGLMPLTIFLKAGGSALAIVPQTAFLVTSGLGLFFGQVYNGLTPDMYESSSHTSWGWVTMTLAIALNIVDVGCFLLRYTRFGATLQEKLARRLPLTRFHQDEGKVPKSEEEDREEEERLISSPLEMEHDIDVHASRGWGSFSHHRQPIRQDSAFSETDTVFDSAGPDPPTPEEWRQSTRSGLHRYGALGFAFAQRMLIILGYIEVCTGVAVWTGSCREKYLNGCLAHIIKGSIFSWYGLLTFARYLGAFSTLGWSWNRNPRDNDSFWTAEFVESLVIFVYGSTNTWMERFGKHGAWGVKDVQHTSIAIMFWAAGTLGMLLESRSVRSWLSTPAAHSSGRSVERISPPASASFPFNPFPALVIGVTGAAMAAHHQTYQFQVDVHQLWGNLLAGFAGLRFMTYFFLFLRYDLPQPPASILPSRPPTEALASMLLTCGGLVFMESTEQVTYAAMRHGWDDIMAFLCLTVAVVLALFTWTAVLFAAKGWALKRNAHLSSSSALAAHAKATALA